MKNRFGVPLDQWAVVQVKFRASDRDFHPAIIVSNQELCDDRRIGRVNVLHGTKTAPGNPARAHQILLNGADGLEFLTAIDCGYFYSVAKDDITARYGEIGAERRRMLKRKIIEVLRLI